MNSVRLNIKLITTLDSVLFISSNRLMTASTIAKPTWYRIMKEPGNITIQQLLLIANNLHIPVKKFFSTGKADIIGKREDYITEDYKQCYYDSEKLHDIVSNNNDVTWKMAAETTGITWQNLRNSLLAERRTPVGRFISVCETFKIDPFTILVDPNKENRHKAVSAAEMTTLRRKMAEMSVAVGDLTEKYKSLLERQSRLEEMLEKYMSEDPSLIVAEPKKGG